MELYDGWAQVGGELVAEENYLEVLIARDLKVYGHFEQACCRANRMLGLSLVIFFIIESKDPEILV